MARPSLISWRFCNTSSYIICRGQEEVDYALNKSEESNEILTEQLNESRVLKVKAGIGKFLIFSYYARFFGVVSTNQMAVQLWHDLQGVEIYDDTPQPFIFILCIDSSGGMPSKTFNGDPLLF